MRIVLDTNVIVSGTFWSGNSFKLLNLIELNNFTIIVSLPILKEYNKIISSKEILNKTTAYQQARVGSLSKILSKAILVNPKEKISIVKEDPDDNKFIEAATEANADYIISQDKHLLKIKKYKNIKILTPEEFLQTSNL
tara:strand:- start:53 stop:469 length:417 start_codon:yes stop_codon:yes gene_type:complete